MGVASTLVKVQNNFRQRSVRMGDRRGGSRGAVVGSTARAATWAVFRVGGCCRHPAPLAALALPPRTERSHADVPGQ